MLYANSEVRSNIGTRHQGARQGSLVQSSSCYEENTVPNQYSAPRHLIKPIGPSIAYVPLTRGMFALIESDDAEIVENIRWNCQFDPSSGVFYARSRIDGVGVGMHILIIRPPKGMVTDHKNGNGLDNRRNANLRPATPQQNNQNQRISRRNTSGYKGVSYLKGRDKWQASIRINGKNKNLGAYDTAAKASEVYQSASIEVHGEFRRSA